MGTVFRKTATKPLPAGAKIIVRKGQRLAEWLDTRGKRRTAPVTVGKDGTDQIVVTAKTYMAKYRDGAGIVQEVPTGCRDEQAARSLLGKLERRAELVKGEVLTAAEDAVIDHQSTPLADHIAAFIDHQKAKGLSRRVKDTHSQLRRVAADCGFRRLADLDATTLERWLLDRKAEGMSAATRNEYRGAWLTFCNRCMATRPARLLSNPFAGVTKADANANRRRTRRALTEGELARLLYVARRRPLLDRKTVHRGKRRGEAYGRLRPKVQCRLERLGRERALIYKTLVLTGLRKGELASITAGQVVLDADPPYLVLEAADEKNREGSTIPLRADLAADLRQWLAEKATVAQEAAREAPAVPFDSEAFPATERNRSDSAGREGLSCLPLTRLPADTPLFTVPAALVRILDRDLVAAGIARRVKGDDGKVRIDKTDERGRTIDVHALRTTFGTLLSAAGVAPRTAQAAMRHSSINLTMNVYTDPRLLDVAGAMEALPTLPLETDPNSTSTALRATGTDEKAPRQFAPKFPGNAGTWCKLQSNSDNGVSWEDAPMQCQETQETPGKQGVSDVSQQWAIRDSNPRHPRCKRGALTN